MELSSVTRHLTFEERGVDYIQPLVTTGLCWSVSSNTRNIIDTSHEGEILRYTALPAWG